MKKSPALLALCLAFAAALATTAAADELSDIYREWRSGPAQILMLPQEEKAWEEVSSDAEAETFIRLFWARRDPTPGTELNEFRREFEQRVAYAREQFTTEETPGELSDRGRVFILLGPPRRVQRPGASGVTAGGIGREDAFGTGGSVQSGTGGVGRGGGLDRTGVSSEERWIYEDDSKPDFVDRKRFTVRFLSEPGSEEVELRNGEAALGYMAEARRLARVNPDLTTDDLGSMAAAAPAQGEVTVMAWMADELSGSDMALDALQEALAGGGGGDDADGASVHLDAGAFQASDGRWIVPFQLSAAEAGQDPARVVGELVREGSGEPALRFRLEQSWSESKGQHYVKDTLVVPPGDYELRVGLQGAEGGVSWAGSEEVGVPEAGDDFWLSELVLSDNVYPMQEAQEMLEPYAWQGIVVVPKGDRAFAQGSLMWFYLHACQPLLDDAGEPSFRVTVKIQGPADTRATVPVQPVAAGDRCWVLAQGVNLAADRFPAGDYEIKVQVRDTERGKTLSSGTSFRVVE